jgi:DHA2 family multidrug resistance protein
VGRRAYTLVAISVVSATLMDVLDRTIVNVALPHMMGTLGATTDSITWVLTSYMIGSAVVMPLTGYLSGRLGRRRLLLMGMAGFIVASVLCGQADTLAEMVVFRSIQGISGAVLIPLAQSTLVDVFPKERRGQAMALFGMGVMVGPAVGPTLGGYLTDTFGWRSIFYVNVPLGLLAMALSASAVPDTPRRETHTDWRGLILIAVGIGAMQAVLDLGNREQWFESPFIVWLAVVAAITLGTFVVRGLRNRRSIVDIRLFGDRNFAASCIMVFVLGLCLYGTVAAQPLFLERLMGYEPTTTGLIMGPRGLATAVAMLIVGRLIGRADPRLLVGGGMLTAGAGTYVMSRYNLDISPAWALWPGVLQGIGLGFVFVPISTLAYDTLPAAASAEAAGLYTLVRTVGGSVGISITATVLTRQEQLAWNRLGGHLDAFNPLLHGWFQAHRLSPHDPGTLARLAAELGRQSSMVAFVDAFYLMTLTFLLLAPLVLILRKPRRQAETPGVDAGG